MFDIKENLKNLPDSPGVYIHKDKLGEVIYVGKAISLRNRVRQYFQSSRNMGAKVRAMVSHIEEFEYITTGSEMEALILECNLIKKYMPKYNVLLRDDKTYPYIKLTTNEEFPRLLKTRELKRDGAKYFGPYSDVGAVNQMLDFLNGVYGFKRCSATSFSESHKPCLNYHIRQCKGVCTGQVSREAYMEKVDMVADFLKGKNREMISHLQEKMSEASGKMEFEKAAKYRDYIMSAKALSEKQRVVLQSSADMDVVLAFEGKEKYIAVFFVRDGKLSGRETFRMQAEEGDDKRDIVTAFIQQYYGEGMIPPREIIVEEEPEDTELLQQYLSQVHGRSIRIMNPKKGEKRALLLMAEKNVVEMVKTVDEREENRRQRMLELGNQIHKVLAIMGYAGQNYDGREYRIEAYDISNTGGMDQVGAMVVFKGTSAEKKSYRRFKIKTIEGQDDYGSMQEVLKRRMARAAAGDPGFSIYPDIILLDGGKGHVNAGLQVLEEMNINIPIIGMAKDDSHRTRALVYQVRGRPSELELKGRPLLYKYIGTIQEEVHRFAISYHRGLRSKKTLVSVLDEIEGIGPKKRNALLAHFGSVDKIKEATAVQLTAVEGITDKLAQNIKEYFLL